MMSHRRMRMTFFFFTDPAPTDTSTLSLHDALPIYTVAVFDGRGNEFLAKVLAAARRDARSEEHTSELQSRQYLVCRLLLEKKKDADDPRILHRARADVCLRGVQRHHLHVLARPRER